MVSTRWTWVASLAVLLAGQSNAHLHYCLDGQEPPVSLHLTDGIDHGREHPGHDAGDHSNDHDDVDVELSLADQALAKVLKLDQPDIASPSGWSVAVAAPPAGAFVEWLASPPAPEPPFLLPQARGPPA